MGFISLYKVLFIQGEDLPIKKGGIFVSKEKKLDLEYACEREFYDSSISPFRVRGNIYLIGKNSVRIHRSQKNLSFNKSQ